MSFSDIIQAYVCMGARVCMHASVNAYVVDMCTCMHVWSVCMYVWHVDILLVSVLHLLKT